MKKKIGVVDVGGGLRGIYAAGILDYCMDQKIEFDLGIGVSAGSANLASYTARQPRRNLQFYSEYALRKEYMSVGNFLKSRNYINMDYVYGTLSNSDGESPLDYEQIVRNPAEFIIVATEAATGKAKYFNKSDIYQDRYDVFKASSAIPYVCRPYIIKGVPYYDGALSDPVPIEKAFDMGCDKVVLILTLPEHIVREPGKDIFLANRIRKTFPIASEKLKHRADKYNEGVELARMYEMKGKLLIVAPNDTCGVSTLSRDVKSLNMLYKKGYENAKRIEEFVS